MFCDIVLIEIIFGNPKYRNLKQYKNLFEKGFEVNVIYKYYLLLKQ